MNRAQRGVLMRTVGPSFNGVQAMVLRRDPLLAHIQTPDNARSTLGAKCGSAALFRLFRLNQCFPKGSHL